MDFNTSVEVGRRRLSEDIPRDWRGGFEEDLETSKKNDLPLLKFALSELVVEHHISRGKKSVRSTVRVWYV